MTDAETKNELTETYNRIDPELSLIRHTMRYAAWADYLLDEFFEKGFGGNHQDIDRDDPAYEWWRNMEDAILNIRTTYTDWVAEFCGYGSVGDSQGKFGDRIRYVRQPYLKDRQNRKELFIEMMEFAGFPFLREYNDGDVLEFFHPHHYRFRMQNETKFNIPERMEEYVE